MTRSVDVELLSLLRCPQSGLALRQAGDALVTIDGSRSYPTTASGIPLFGGAGLSPEAEIQQRHYQAIAERYADNLAQEHTREYFAYLDRRFSRLVGPAPLDTVVEICCGAGEAFQLLGPRARLGIGVDVSTAMLERARAAVPGRGRLFVQGDAVRLPLAGESFDAAFFLGGIHHVNDRAALFAEARRILKPGGRLFWREPVDDFLPWRIARRAIYRTSATLQADTEHPLRQASTTDQLRAAGLALTAWETLGFAGYCVLMNGDVLPINRVWSRIPGSRWITRMAAGFDDAALRLPGLRRAGALVIGSAVRPASSARAGRPADG
jgi:SAM-dependent methyltransferase